MQEYVHFPFKLQMQSCTFSLVVILPRPAPNSRHVSLRGDRKTTLMNPADPFSHRLCAF